MRPSKQPTPRIASFCIGLLLLATVGIVDFATGYRITVLVFYFIPILYVLRRAGQTAAFGMAVLANVVWLLADVTAGDRYPDIWTPVWNTGVRMAIFILVIILASARNELQVLVRQRTEKLEHEMQERTRLERELLEIAEAEQRRIGQDLHDSLGQHLTATAMAGKLLAKKLADKSPAEAAAATKLVSLTEEAIELTRKLAHSLHPVELESGGLAGALQQLAANVSQAFGVMCRFESTALVKVADIEVGTQLFRIAQEATSNAIRHGRARKIVISLEGSDEKWLLSVTDDGGGLPDESQTKNGLGLRIMDYRARMIGAVFEIRTLPAGGTRAVCTWNLDTTSDKNDAKN
ncbi:MAG TPA: sensor histidine kinase [Candidatus Sulfotelmatobacter sp.]|nr:sensor histidine kinase [Candidatus Sulfotelmatobacter sp.]